MNRQFLRQLLLSSSGRFLRWSKQLHGAADKMVPQSKLFLSDCIEAEWKNVFPCFVLSTGRSGTLLLTRILELADNAAPLHEPRPELFRASKRAYEEIHQQPDLFKEVLLSAREEYLLAAARRKQRYIETNNQISFFAPIIPQLFPNAVFIHLVRHPADFVRSGMRRNWYTGEHSHDIGRITPISGDLVSEWTSLSRVEKIAWLWNETNEFIETLVKEWPERFLQVRAETLFASTEESKRIFDFMELNGYNRHAVDRILQKPANPQRKGNFPKYNQWTDEDKAGLRRFATLAENYDYELL
ncbi:MAG: sulfotransferase [Calditrichota bacterium]